MMAEPTEEAISSVCEFANLDPVGDRNLVIAALRAKSNNVEAVVLAFYDDPDKFRQLYTWDESSFMGDRDGYNPNLPSFNIQGADDNGMGMGNGNGNGNGNPNNAVIHGIAPSQLHSVPPSRPPSRAQSPLSRMADWAANDMGAPTSMDQADKDLERALAESAAMSGLHTPQESGITGGPYSQSYSQSYPQNNNVHMSTELPFFGPANRDAYDPDQWAMVRAVPESSEPAPSGRKRVPGVPVFLRSRRPGTEATSLGALLTILHAIPAARNALLKTGFQAATYGQNSEWWKGSRIEPAGLSDNESQNQNIAMGTSTTTVINVDSDEDEITDSTNIGGGTVGDGPKLESRFVREYVDEVHRLMAFLDNTDRAYGTADNLAETTALKECYDIETSQKFFEAARRMDLTEIMDQFFHAVQLNAVKQIGVPLRTESYAILEVKVDDMNVPFGVTDLYSAIDVIFWEDLYRFDASVVSDNDANINDANMAVLTKIGPVKILRLNTPKRIPFEQPFDVPEHFYMDRYTAENSARALEIQVQMQKVYRAIRKVEAAREETLNFVDRTENPPVLRNTITLSEQAITFAVQKEWQYRAQMVWDRYMAAQNTPQAFDYSVAEIYNAAPETDDEKAMLRTLQVEIAVHRQKLIDLRTRVERFDRERVALEELTRRLRRKYTAPPDKENWNPTNSYALRGVIVSPDKFYFCRREVPAEPKSERGEAAQTEAGAEGAAPPAEDAPSTAASTPPAVDQWWMVSYNSKDTVPVTIQKTTIDVARASVFQESRSPVLVYANDEALTADDLPLSDALRTFVRFDNRFFKQETLEENNNDRTQQAQGTQDSPRGENDKKRMPAEEASPTSPLKRRQRSGSIDSMASNMASLGDVDSDRDMDDVPLLGMGTPGASSSSRFPLDMEEDNFFGTLPPESGPHNSEYNMHEWAVNRSIEEAIARRTGSSANIGVGWPGDDPSQVLPQREVDTPPGYDETTATTTVDQNTNDSSSEHRGSLGTEMVQLAIHSDASQNEVSSVNVNGTATGADAGHTTPRANAATEGSPELAIANGTASSQMQEVPQTQGKKVPPPPPPRSKKPQMPQKAKATGEVQLLADWDNPEGRYVAHVEDARQHE